MEEQYPGQREDLEKLDELRRQADKELGPAPFDVTEAAASAGPPELTAAPPPPPPPEAPYKRADRPSLRDAAIRAEEDNIS